MKVTLITIIFFPKRKVNKSHKEILIILYIYIYTHHKKQELKLIVSFYFSFFGWKVVINSKIRKFKKSLSDVGPTKRCALKFQRQADKARSHVV